MAEGDPAVPAQGRGRDALLDHVADAVYTVDTDDVITYLNRAAAASVGLTRERLLGTNLFGSVPTLRDTPLAGHFRDARERGTTVRFQAWFGAPWETWFEVDVHPLDGELAVAFRDVSDHKRREAERQEAESTFLRLFEANPLPMWVFDAATFRFLAVNDAAVHQYGYTRNEFLARTILDIRPSEEVERVRTEVAGLGTGYTTRGTYTHLRKDGSELQVEIDANDVPFFGRRARLVAVRDVTESIRSRREVEATRDGTLRALGLALEYRDFETRGHTDRVVDLSTRFARIADLDEASTQALAWAAYLHDLGKVALPDALLLKPGPLDADEFEQVKQHTLIGERMCAGIPFLPPATRATVRSHHERWDGSGYPDGLAGEEIPFLARVFAIVDVYDALVSRRPYKPAWPDERARSELRAQAGAQFDARLVDRFLREVLGS